MLQWMQAEEWTYDGISSIVLCRGQEGLSIYTKVWTQNIKWYIVWYLEACHRSGRDLGTYWYKKSCYNFVHVNDLLELLVRAYAWGKDLNAQHVKWNPVHPMSKRYGHAFGLLPLKWINDAYPRPRRGVWDSRGSSKLFDLYQFDTIWNNLKHFETFKTYFNFISCAIAPA